MASGHDVSIGTGTPGKVFSCALLILLLLILPVHSQEQFCPGDMVSSFNCTTENSHVWNGSALAGQCPADNNVINVSGSANAPCGIFSATITDLSTSMGVTHLSTNISFIATVTLDGTEVVCRDADQAIVGSYPIKVMGPMAPILEMNVTFPVLRQQFAIQWVSQDNTATGFQVTAQGPMASDRIVCEDTRSNSSAVESRCSWEESAIDSLYTLTVSALNCDSSLEGPPSGSVNVSLQVPVAPNLTACPVYNQSTTKELLRIDSNCSTVPAVTIANGVDGSPDAYIFSYNGGSQSVVPSGQCTGGTCTDVFTPTDPTVSQYTVSVTARNVVGEGPPDTRLINATNSFVEVGVNVTARTVQCRFLGGFTGTAECQIEYSPQEDLSGSVVDTGNSTSGDTVTVTLTVTLEGRTTYYYLVTATAEGVSVRVQGFFQTECFPRELGMEVPVSIFSGDFVGFVRIPTGRAFYTGTVPGSMAVYFSDCDDQYMVVGERNRFCQGDGTWNGTVPNIERKLFTTGLVLGIIGAIFYVIIMITILVIAIVVFRVYTRLTSWLFAIVLVVWLILPPIGLALAIWLVRKKVAFVKKWCIITFLIMMIGNFLWFINLGIWIAAAVLFGPSNGNCVSVGILVAGVVVGVITGLYWITVGCILRWKGHSSSDETDDSGSGKAEKTREKKSRGKKTRDIQMDSTGEYGKLQHGTMSPVLTNAGDQTYSQLAADKVEEASGEEYSQLNRKKPPQPVPNIGDPNYSHFQGGQQEYSQLQHDQPPPVPPHTVQDPPMEYAEVNPGPRFTSKKMSATNL